MQRHTPVPSATVLTPDELLANAEKLYASPDPNMMRGAVLEAIAALETFVHTRVFSSLKDKLDPPLVRWLEDKTKMDFDSRLRDLAPVATGQPVDTRGQLWQDYKRAKVIRNNVTHTGASVDKADARFVIDTVYRWLEFLGARVEILVALIGLKRYFQRRTAVPITSEKDAVDLIVRYFSKTRAAQLTAHPASVPPFDVHPDVLLRIGTQLVVVEAKFVRGGQIQHAISVAVDQVLTLIDRLQATVGAVVIFYKGELDPLYEDIRTLKDGRVYVLLVHA